MNHTRSKLAFATLLPALVLVALAAFVLPVDSGRAAQSTSTIGLVAVDVDTSGNTAASLGGTETCRRVESGASVDVDIIVNQVPRDRPMTALQFTLFYDQAVVNVTARDLNLLILAIPDPSVEPFGPITDPVPDFDGAFTAATLDRSQTAQETGPGVLGRLTLRAVGNGLSILSPNADPNALLVQDHENQSIPIKYVGAAYLAVGVDCPAETPTTLSQAPGANTSVVPAPQYNPPSGPTETPAPELTGTPVAPEGTSPSPGRGGDSTPTPAGAAGNVGGSDEDEDKDSSKDDSNGGDGFPVWVIGLIAAIAGVSTLGGGAYLYRRRLH